MREHGRDPAEAYPGDGLSAADLGSRTEQDRRSMRRVGARTVVA